MKPKRLITLLLAAVLCFTLVIPAFAADTAANMQLSKTTGTVTVTNASARTLSVKENMRLYNGYTVETAAASYAWINLDNAKLVKLDACSKVEVRKSGKKLEVLLKSGSLYGDVSQPLENDESMNIRTSTAIVGIRGTKFQVGHSAPAGSETGQLPNTLVSVMEGKVSVTTQNTLDNAAAPDARPAVQTTAVAAGQTAVIAAAPPAAAGDSSPTAVTVDVAGLQQKDLSGSTQTELTTGGSFTIKTPEGQAVTLTPAAAEQQLKQEQAEQLQAAAPSQPPEQTGPGQQDTTANVWGGGQEEAPPEETPSGGGSSTVTPAVRYTVSFDSQGGSAVASVSVAQGERPFAPAAPTREGYTFTGWYTDSACTAAYRFMTPVTQDLALYAGWKELPPAVTTCTVTFDSKGGSAVEAQTGASGFTPTRPADPTKAGYGFEGWFTDSTCKAAYHFDTPVTHNLTLYAKWGYFATLDGGSGDLAEQLNTLYGKGYSLVIVESGTLTVSGSLAIPAGKTLEISSSATLKVSAGAALTNSGILTVDGSLNNDGTIINGGTINNNGTIGNNEGGIINNSMGSIQNDYGIINNYGQYTGGSIGGIIGGSNAGQMQTGNP